MHLEQFQDKANTTAAPSLILIALTLRSLLIATVALTCGNLGLRRFSHPGRASDLRLTLRQTVLLVAPPEAFIVAGIDQFSLTLGAAFSRSLFLQKLSSVVYFSGTSIVQTCSVTNHHLSFPAPGSAKAATSMPVSLSLARRAERERFLR